MSGLVKAWARGISTAASNVRLAAGALVSYLAFRSRVANDATRVYLVPNGTPAGVTAALKIFGDDYNTNQTDYRDLGIYFDKAIKGPQGAGTFLLNSKSNGDLFAHMAQIGMSRSDGVDIPLRLVPLYTGATEAQLASYAAAYRGPWVQGLAITAGDTVSAGVNSYQATTSGTAGATKPTHTAGTASDGGVTWQWLWDNSTGGTGNDIRTYVILGDKGDAPIWSKATKVRNAPVQITRDVVIHPSRRFILARGVAASGSGIAGQFGVRDGATHDVWLTDEADAIGARWNLDPAEPFSQLVGMSRVLWQRVMNEQSGVVTAGGCEVLIIANTVAGAVITGFAGYPAGSVLVVKAGAENITLQHNIAPGTVGAPTLRNASGASLNLSSLGAITYYLNSQGTQWIQDGAL